MIVKYKFINQIITARFSHPLAKLPILTKDNKIIKIPWGRRRHEAGNLPLGGYADLDSIHRSIWDEYLAKPVKLPIFEFMAKDIEDRAYWFTVTKGQYIQGLLASYQDEKRVYIVTIVPKLKNFAFTSWPRLIK